MTQPTEGTVKIRIDGKTGRGHISGVKRCASPWACPRCAPTIRQRRAAELTAVVERAQAEGHCAVLVTYTLPHKADEALTDVFGDLGAAWRKMWSGAWAESFRAEWGVVGTFRAIEVTYGDNGWHPHVHAVMFFDRSAETVGADLPALWVQVFKRWAAVCEATCGRRPSARNGVDVELVHDAHAVGDYVSDAGGWSIGAEVACQPAKIGRSGNALTPFGLLGAAAMWGDLDAARLWWEYERATKGRHAIQASRGLYERYQVVEVDDDEAAAPEADDVVATVEVDPMAWVLLVEYHEVDRFVIAVERWAVDGARGSPPDPVEHLRGVLDARSNAGTFGTGEGVVVDPDATSRLRRTTRWCRWKC